MRADGFSCSLDGLFGGLGISKLQFLIKETKKRFFSCIFFFNFGHQNPDADADPDPDPDLLANLYPDPRHWF
jgi:hypothetical protein